MKFYGKAIFFWVITQNSFKDGMKNEWVFVTESSKTILLQNYILLGGNTNGFLWPTRITWKVVLLYFSSENSKFFIHFPYVHLLQKENKHNLEFETLYCLTHQHFVGIIVPKKFIHFLLSFFSMKMNTYTHQKGLELSISDSFP
jgi:hypothetical protein